MGIPDLRPTGAASLKSSEYDTILRIAAVVVFAVGSGKGRTEESTFGTNVPRMRDMQAAMKEIRMVCVWRSAKLPIIIDRRTAGSSNSPMFAAVLSLAERFISRFPLRFKSVGMIMMSWSTSCMACQRFKGGSAKY